MITAISLGAAARLTLENNRAGKVLAVFKHSFYLQAEDGALICVGSAALGAGPLHLLCAVPESMDWCEYHLVPNMAWQRNAQQIVLLCRRYSTLGYLILDYSQADTWCPTALPVTDTIQLKIQLKRGLQALSSILQDQAKLDSKLKPVGLGILIPDLIRQSLNNKSVSNDAVLRHAVPAIQALTTGLLSTTPRPLHAAQILIGLGSGLTPSGDDFIGGMLIVLSAAGASDKAKWLANWTLPIASTHTNSISFAHLCCAADGMGSEVLHQMLSALWQADHGLILHSLLKLDGIGHSSGWDMLAGVVCGCAILLANPLSTIS